MPQLIKPPAAQAAMVEHALWWASFHHSVFPLCPHDKAHNHDVQDKGEWVAKPCPEKDWGKRPITAWGKSATKDPDKIRALWAKHPTANIGGTPDEGFFWLDKDTPDPQPAEWPATFKQRTSADFKWHLLYRQPSDPTRQVDQTQPGNQYWPGYDTRVAGKGYVVLSPSMHHSGTRYAIESAVDPVEFPAAMLPDRVGKSTRLRGKVDGQATADKEVVGLLHKIIDTPESPDLGNGAFAKIASRLAKLTPGDMPLFRALLRVANAAIAVPLDETDLSKMEGIWTKTEDRRLTDQEIKSADGSKGWLYEGGHEGYTTLVGSGDKIEPVAWSNFRVTAKSLVDYGDHQVWIVDFHKADGTTLENVELPSEVLSSTATLRRFLVNRGMSLLAPSNDKRGNHGERLLCLLQSQAHERQSVIDHYGWDKSLEAFVTPDSLIRADSVTPAVNKLKVKDDRLHYGFDEGATDALREFLTFHDETYTSVVGSFLIATLLRGHYPWQAPNLAIEAHAGAGKSTYLRMLGQFCGIKREPGHFSLPVARDAYELSTNIFNWFDDVEMNDHLQGLFRQSGTGGTYEIKDIATGFKETRKVNLHASTVLTAERITFLEQKAMADRFLLVDMPNASERKSVHDPNRSQWFDVVAFNERHGNDLTRFAGTLVQLALKHVAIFDQLDKLTTSTSRPGQMVAIMRASARVLAAIVGDDSHITRVDAWAASFDFSIAPSIVLNTVIPRVWSKYGNSTDRFFGDAALQPVYFDEVTGCFNIAPARLAEVWREMNPRLSPREAELTNDKAIIMELKAVGCCPGRAKCGQRLAAKDRESRKTQTYHLVPATYTDVIWQAATGHVRMEDGDNV